MAGLAVLRKASLSLAYDPAVHVFLRYVHKEDVDARDKRRHDG